jgi:hypothetical protein
VEEPGLVKVNGAEAWCQLPSQFVREQDAEGVDSVMDFIMVLLGGVGPLGSHVVPGSEDVDLLPRETPPSGSSGISDSLHVLRQPHVGYTEECE